MSEHFNRLSEKVVTAFRSFLSDEAAAAIGDEGFDQLGMLIEAHITDEVLVHLEKVANQVEELAEHIRGDAENFSD